MTSIDLTKGTKPKEVVFRFDAYARLFDMALETITSEHRDLPQILIYIYSYVTKHTGSPLVFAVPRTLETELRSVGELNEPFDLAGFLEEPGHSEPR